MALPTLNHRWRAGIAAVAAGSVVAAGVAHAGSDPPLSPPTPPRQSPSGFIDRVSYPAAGGQFRPSNLQQSPRNHNGRGGFRGHSSGGVYLGAHGRGHYYLHDYHGYYPNYYYPWDWYGTYNGPPLLGQVSRIDPALASPAPPPEPPDPDLVAWDALAAGRYAEAVLRHRDLLSEADAEAPEFEQRLVLALAGADRFREAATVAADLLVSLPTVAAAPLDGAAFVPDPIELRGMVTGAVRHAHREPSVEAWLLVALLMEVEGRGEVAARMVDRAAALGLDPDLAATLADTMRLVGPI